MVRSEARSIGRTGEYPYAAMGAISERLASGKHTEIVVQIFREALEFYGQGPRVRSADREFIDYFEVAAPYLPVSLQREALEVLVAHLTRKREPDPAVTEVARFATEKGTISFQDRQVALLYEILPQIRRIDPDWANRLQEEFPDLRQTGGAIKYSLRTTVFSSEGAPAERVAAEVDRGLQENALGQLRNLAQGQPDQAATLLASLNDPDLQSEGLASLAKASAESDPHRSAELLASAQGMTDKIPNGVPRLQALISVAEAAAALHDNSKADGAIAQAFDLGEELVSEELDLHPGEPVYLTEPMEDLSRLTRLAVQFEFASATTRLDHLKDRTLQAYLLIAAAEGLQEQKSKLSSQPAASSRGSRQTN